MNDSTDNPLLPLPQAFLDAVQEAFLQVGEVDKLEVTMRDFKPEYPVVKDFFASPEMRDLWHTRT